MPTQAIRTPTPESKTTTIARISHGHRRKLGISWPVETIVQREQRLGRVHWLVLSWLCNGVADSVESFPTRRKALEFAGLWLGQGMEAC